ncbi:hypothetical protein [Mucilaginibacter gilvus]|uniref:hypothetical protein n=1 Tax=Mucilaginibacter gilvus TaxID=2305909 RepID=UPI0014192A91|nr:hypothetical protein [Mucilaginibacter gilvus]
MDPSNRFKPSLVANHIKPSASWVMLFTMPNERPSLKRVFKHLIFNRRLAIAQQGSEQKESQKAKLLLHGQISDIFHYMRQNIH